MKGVCPHSKFHQNIPIFRAKAEQISLQGLKMNVPFAFGRIQVSNQVSLTSVDKSCNNSQGFCDNFFQSSLWPLRMHLSCTTH